MGNGREVDFYAELVAKVVEFLGGEVAAIIGEDAMWYAKSASDAFEELDCGGG